MRAHVIFDKTASYNFSLDEYKRKELYNCIMFYKKDGNFNYDYIFIKWDKNNLYHYSTNSSGELDTDEFIWELIEEFKINGEF
jgi:hypothetical protein